MRFSFYLTADPLRMETEISRDGPIKHLWSTYIKGQHLRTVSISVQSNTSGTKFKRDIQIALLCNSDDFVCIFYYEKSKTRNKISISAKIKFFVNMFVYIIKTADENKMLF